MNRETEPRLVFAEDNTTQEEKNWLDLSLPLQDNLDFQGNNGLRGATSYSNIINNRLLEVELTENCDDEVVQTENCDELYSEVASLAPDENNMDRAGHGICTSVVMLHDTQNISAPSKTSQEKNVDCDSESLYDDIDELVPADRVSMLENLSPQENRREKITNVCRGSFLSFNSKLILHMLQFIAISKRVPINNGCLLT